MKVCLDTLVFGLQKRGGVSGYWYEIISRMIKDENIELTLLETHYPYINKQFNELDKTRVTLINEKWNNLQLLRNLSPKLPASTEMVIFQSTYLRTVKKKNYKNIVTIHDFTHQFYFKGIKKWLNSIQKRKAIKWADGIICISESTKKDLLKKYPKISPDRIRVIYNGASNNYHPIDNFEIPHKYAAIKGKKYFIYVGDRFSYKNTQFFFKVLRSMENMFCVLVGGKEFTKTETKEIYGIKDRIYCFTDVTDKELNILYNSAHACVFPSLYEGFGIPVLEAMKAGCPVVAFNNSSIPEVMNNSGIMLQDNDLEGCVQALEKLNDNDYRKMIVEKEIKAGKKFSWDRTYGEMINLYKHLLSHDFMIENCEK